METTQTKVLNHHIQEVCHNSVEVHIEELI